MAAQRLASVRRGMYLSASAMSEARSHSSSLDTPLDDSGIQAADGADLLFVTVVKMGEARSLSINWFSVTDRNHSSSNQSDGCNGPTHASCAALSQSREAARTARSAASPQANSSMALF